MAPVSSAAVQPAADAADTAGTAGPEEAAAASVGTAAAAVGLYQNLPAEAAHRPARVLYLLIYHHVIALAEKDKH